MTGVDEWTAEAFDFSKDAELFRAKLWNRLKESVPAADIRQLEDEELEWVNAAGMVVRCEEADSPLPHTAL